MFGKCLSLSLAALLLLSAAPAQASAGRQEPAEAARLEKLRERAGKLARKRRAKARVKLNDGRKLRGRITEAADEYFVIVSSETHTAYTVRYPQVLELKESRPSGLFPAVAAWGVFFGLVVIPLLVSGPT